MFSATDGFPTPRCCRMSRSAPSTPLGGCAALEHAAWWTVTRGTATRVDFDDRVVHYAGPLGEVVQMGTHLPCPPYSARKDGDRLVVPGVHQLMQEQGVNDD
jgi:hypothetical protein